MDQYRWPLCLFRTWLSATAVTIFDVHHNLDSTRKLTHRTLVHGGALRFGRWNKRSVPTHSIWGTGNGPPRSLKFSGCNGLRIHAWTSTGGLLCLFRTWLKDNQARLQLFALAYNLGNLMRQLALPREVKHWSLTTVRERLIKIGA